MTIPIDPLVAQHVRTTRTDPVYGYDYDVRADEAGPDGYGPCRSCLRRFTAGERRLLFLFNPFTSEYGDFAGPVFIHEDDCKPFDESGFPPDLRGIPLLLRAYNDDADLVAERRPGADEIEAAVDELLADERASLLHVRNAEAKCYIARIAPLGARSAAPELAGMRGGA